MNDQATQFQELIRQVQLGSQDAARQLADSYGPALRRYVRRHIHRTLRHQFDSLDFVQLVWASFFCDPHSVPRLETPQHLAAYLAKIAEHKVVDEGRRLQSQKQDVQRLVRLDQPERTVAVPGREPTPSAVAMFHEEWDSLVTRQPVEVGKVVQLRYEGATYREIAEELQIDERTARRQIDRLERSRAVDSTIHDVETPP